MGTRRNFARRLAKDRKGNALLIVGAGLPMLIGAAGIAVDSIQLALTKRQLQRSADSAAIAGAYGVLRRQSVQQAATRDLQLNNEMVLAASPVVENAPTTGSYRGNNRAVRVVLRADRVTPFMSFFGGGATTVQVESTAAAVFSAEMCVISLENTAVTGVTFAGSTTVNLGCGVASNSTATAAISAGGASAVTASPIAAVGGVPASSSYRGTTELYSNSIPQEDPFAGLPDATVPPNCQNQLNVQPNQTRTVSPGCYRGMDIKGTAILQPGTYIIDGGTLSFGAQANITGVGVTFILTSSNAVSNPSSIATLDMHGGAILDIKAPADGTYKGVLLYQDRRATLTNIMINGNSASRFQGSFYLPSQQVTFNGNTGMQTRCVQFVARRLVFTGNSNIQNVCPENEGSKAFETLQVRLVN